MTIKRYSLPAILLVTAMIIVGCGGGGQSKGVLAPLQKKGYHEAELVANSSLMLSPYVHTAVLSLEPPLGPVGPGDSETAGVDSVRYFYPKPVRLTICMDDGGGGAVQSVVMKDSSGGEALRVSASGCSTADLQPGEYRTYVYHSDKGGTKTVFIQKGVPDTAVHAETERKGADIGSGANLQILVSTNSCVGCDLSGVNDDGGDFSSADLSYATIEGSSFKGALFYGAKFIGADLTGSDFTGAKLTGAQMMGARMVNTKLNNADMTSANMQNLTTTEVIPSSAPTAVYRSGAFVAYVRGSDGAVWEYNAANNTWTSLGGNIQGGPSAVQYGSRTWVYARWSDNSLYVRQWNGSQWLDWQKVTTSQGYDQPVLSSSPSASNAYLPTGHWIAFRGANGTLWKMRVSLDRNFNMTSVSTLDSGAPLDYEPSIWATSLYADGTEYDVYGLLLRGEEIYIYDFVDLTAGQSTNPQKNWAFQFKGQPSAPPVFAYFDGCDTGLENIFAGFNRTEEGLIEYGVWAYTYAGVATSSIRSPFPPAFTQGSPCLSYFFYVGPDGRLKYRTVKDLSEGLPEANVQTSAFSDEVDAGIPVYGETVEIPTDFSGADLGGAVFDENPKITQDPDNRAKFVGTTMYAGSINKTYWRYFDMTNAVIEPDPGETVLQLSSADAPLNMQNSIMSGVDLSNAILDGADFSGSTLVGTKFNEASLQKALFTDVKANGADFTWADLTGASFEGAYLNGDDTNHINPATFSYAYMEAVDMSEAHLSGATLTNVDFYTSGLGTATLNGAILVGAKIGNSYLKGLVLDNSHFEGADFSGSVLLDASIKSPQLGSYSSTGNISFTTALLAGADFSTTVLSDAVLTNSLISIQKGTAQLTHRTAVKVSKTTFEDYGVTVLPQTANGATCPDGLPGSCGDSLVRWKPHNPPTYEGVDNPNNW